MAGIRWGDGIAAHREAKKSGRSVGTLLEQCALCESTFRMEQMRALALGAAVANGFSDARALLQSAEERMARALASLDEEEKTLVSSLGYVLRSEKAVARVKLVRMLKEKILSRAVWARMEGCVVRVEVEELRKSQNERFDLIERSENPMIEIDAETDVETWIGRLQGLTERAERLAEISPEKKEAERRR